MALEDAINKLATLIEKQNGLLEKLLSTTSAKGAAAPAADAPAAETKPKATKPKAAATEGAGEVDIAEARAALEAKLRPWLSEFGKEHVETQARGAKFKEMLGKVGEAKLATITDATKIGKLDTWFENKAKSWDEGHGIGRFAADPAAAGDEDGGDDEL